MKEHILINDDDGHWYVIPSNKETAFNKWISSGEAEDGVTPDYAIEVGGCPSLVKFKDFRIE